MSKQKSRLKQAQLEADKASFAALKAIKGYAPSNPAYTVEAIQKALDEMTDSQEAEAQADAAQAAARDKSFGSEWTFHDLVLGSKDQVTAQFGRNSDEVQSVGLTKKSERKTPTRGKKGGGGGGQQQ